MTLAIGAKYPWGELNKLVGPGSEPPEAIILASDSRWTYHYSSMPYRDIGTKLFQLGIDVGAVYAGYSQVGEECLYELGRQLSRQNMPDSKHSRELAQKVFRRTYKHHLASRGLSPDEWPLYILIGTCNAMGRAELYHFRYSTNFEAEPLTGLKAIGWPDAKDKFNERFEEELRKQVRKELSLRSNHPKIPLSDLDPMPIKPMHVATFISAVLTNIIESKAHKTVGGKVQCAVISTEGFSQPRLLYTSDPTNEGPGWAEATANPDELETATGIFGFHSLSD